MSLRRLVLASLTSLAGCSSAPTHPLDAGGGSTGGTFTLSIPKATCYGSSTPQSASDNEPLCSGNQPSTSFAKDVQPIFAGCGGSDSCHVPWTYETTVNAKSQSCCDRRSLIAPGKPSDSLLVQAVRDSGACIPRMPLAGQLDDTSIAAIVAWVCRGAPND